MICYYKLGLEKVLGRNEATFSDQPLFDLGINDGLSLLKTNRLSEIPVRCAVCENYCSDLYESPSKINLNSLDKLADKFVGSILGVGIGDSMGSTFEGVQKTTIISELGYINGFIGSIRHPKGTYTDDTELTLIVAQSIGNDLKFNEDIFKRKLVEWLNNNPRTPGEGMIKAAKYINGTAVENPARHNYSNGAAIRLAPVALVNLGGEKKLESELDRMTKQTHDNSLAYCASLCLGSLISYTTKNTPETFNRSEISDMLIDKSKTVNKEFSDRLGFAFASFNRNFDSTVQKIGTGSLVSESVVCSIYISLRQYDNFKRAILSSVNSGGDSDSIASMVGAVCGALHGANKLPKYWIDTLENQDSIIRESLGLYQKYTYAASKPDKGKPLGLSTV